MDTQISVGFVNSAHGCMGPVSECVRQVCCSACEVGSTEFTTGVQLSHHSSSTTSLYTFTETRKQEKRLKGKLLQKERPEHECRKNIKEARINSILYFLSDKNVWLDIQKIGGTNVKSRGKA